MALVIPAADNDHIYCLTFFAIYTRF